MTFSKIFGNRIQFVITNDRSDSGIVLIRNPDLIQEFVTHGMPVRRQRILLSVDIHQASPCSESQTPIKARILCVVKRGNGTVDEC